MAESTELPKPRDFATAFKMLEMSPSGRPQMLPDEVEIVTKQDTTVYESLGPSGLKERLAAGLATVTTHRLLWLGAVGGSHKGRFCNLWDVAEIRANPGGRFKSSSKIQLYLMGQTALAYAAVVLRVDSGRDELLDRLCSAHARRAWVKFTTRDIADMYGAAAATAAGDGSGVAVVGVAAILKRQEMNRLATRQIASDVSSDLGSLMDKAKEVVAVIERYSAELARKRQEEEAAAAAAGTGGSSSGGGSSVASDGDGLGDLVLSIGITNPVTKGNAGTEYHHQLARQLAGFLTERGLLARFGSMMTLPDLYAVLNRARGTALISPPDLLQACELLRPLRLGMSLRRFESGVAVVQSDAFDAAALELRLTALARQAGWIIAAQAARELGVSVTLAGEHLAESERAGLLCRDDTFEGVRFFLNRFGELAQEWEEAGGWRGGKQRSAIQAG